VPHENAFFVGLVVVIPITSLHPLEKRLLIIALELAETMSQQLSIAA
jgi:hypothetical protein